ncbi:MAG: ATP-binding protein [Armatimonadota bacterium]|jgi:NAD-dependent dihydropyrimidine dehydrogenase PreA subunit
MATKTLRKIIHIDEDRCDGCGLCVPSCEEGAIQIIDGKAKLVAENLCDGLGNCLGECPRDAITIEEREAEDFDEAAVEEHLREIGAPAASPCSGGGCPGSAAIDLGAPGAAPAAGPAGASQPSQLQNWPIQLALVPVHAPWLERADLLISADCVPYALGSFQGDLLAGKQVITACPKLDDVGPYLRKLTEIFATHDVKRVTVARMEVPCCSGLSSLVRRALQEAGSDAIYEELIVKIGG